MSDLSRRGPGRSGSVGNWRYALSVCIAVVLTAAVVGGRGWGGDNAPAQGADGQGPTPFAVAKAEWLLRHRLPCLGCHTLSGQGGRIGPSLDGVGARLSPTDIEAVVRDPARARPGGVAIMPRIVMPQSMVSLVVAYLAGRTEGTAPAQPRSASPVRTAPTPTPGASDSPAALYGRRCAPCHGTEGDGDGYNAQYLPTRPTAHSSAAYMSTRSDDVLYDGIAAGGYVLGRSHLMPSFGATLTPSEIRGLVGYLRELCECEGPSWSRDGR